MAFKVEIGDKLAKLKVVEEAESRVDSQGKIQRRWKCICDCGNSVTVSQPALASRTRPTQSCGCLRLEKIKGNSARETHGESRTRLYSIWQKMIARCERRYCKDYGRYGARGIAVCQEWHQYEAFAGWAKTNGYSDSLTIERIDFNGNYSPDNCTWIPPEEQALNRRSSRFITAWGETKVIADWLKDSRCKVGRSTLGCRLRLGWDAQTAILTPPTRQYHPPKRTKETA